MKTPTLNYERSLKENHKQTFEKYISANIPSFEKKQELRKRYEARVTNQTIREICNQPISVFVRSLTLVAKVTA